MAKIQYRWNFYPKEKELPDYRGMILQAIFISVLVYIVFVIVGVGFFYM